MVSYSERRQSRGPGEKVDLNRGKKFLLPGPIIINFNLLKSKYWLKFHIYFSFQDLSWELICKLNDLKIHVLLTARKLFNLAVIQRELWYSILWNNLPQNLRFEQNFICFKKLLNTYLFSKAYPDYS